MLRTKLYDALKWIVAHLPERVRWELYDRLTGQVVYKMGRSPQDWPRDVRAFVGVVRWYFRDLDPPRPSWEQLQRWANLDDPRTAELREAEARRSTLHLED